MHTWGREDLGLETAVPVSLCARGAASFGRCAGSVSDCVAVRDGDVQACWGCGALGAQALCGGVVFAAPETAAFRGPGPRWPDVLILQDKFPKYILM